MPSRDLKVNIDGDSSGIDRAFTSATLHGKEYELELERLERQHVAMQQQLTRTEEQLRKQTEATKKQSAETQASAGWLGSAAGAATLMTGSMAAATVGFTLFAAVAAPSVLQVVKAQKDLSASWDGLDAKQKASAVSVQGLTGDYQNLAKSYEPQALGVFNSFVETGRSLLPQLSSALGMSMHGVQDFAGQVSGFVGGRDVSSFLSFAGATAPQALHMLGTTATTTGSLVLQLAQNVAPMGMSLLSVANGGLGLANMLVHTNPLLSQMAVTGLAMRAPMTALQGGVSSLATSLSSKFSPSTGAAAGAMRLLNAAAGAGPGLYIAAGTALAFFVLKAMSAQSATDKLIASITVSTRAYGNNIDGYQAKINQLNSVMAKLNATTAAQAPLINAGKDQMMHYTAGIDETQAALDRTRKQMANVKAGADQLAASYGITRDQAITLANAAGVDLSQSLDGSGKLTLDAKKKMDQYVVAVEQSKDPLRVLKEGLDQAANSGLQMKDRVQGLTEALNAAFNPSIALYDAQIQLKDGYSKLLKQLDSNRDGLKGNTDASRQNQQALSDQMKAVENLYTATFNQTKNEKLASQAVKDQLPILYALAGNNREARAQVDALAQSTGNMTGKTNVSRAAFLANATAMGIAKDRAIELWNKLQEIHDRSANITINASGNWSATAGQNLPPAHFAEGGPVPKLWDGANRQTDSQPALLRVDEHVWTPEEVDAMGGHKAVERLRKAALRGELKGFRSGGQVSFTGDHRSNDAVVGQVLSPIESGTAKMLNDLANAMAAVWKQFASAGSVVAAARSQIGIPYSWGGGGIGGPSYGIAQGAGIYGYDCSGLTEYAWYKGRGIDIGGVTDSQWANSTPISGPRPGALAFPEGPSVHVMLGSDKPGYVIQAPHTGAFVEEVPRSSGNWRWPSGAGMYSGGRVVPGTDVGGVLAKLLGLMGDPGGVVPGFRRLPGRAGGGPVDGGMPYLVGELGPEIFTPQSAGSVSPAGSTVVHQDINVTIQASPGTDRHQLGKEVNELLYEYKRRGGKLVKP